jgi:hypothetical protein
MRCVVDGRALMVDAHVIARGGQMFEFFEGFLRPFDSSPSSDQSSSDRCMNECESHHSEML